MTELEANKDIQLILAIVQDDQKALEQLYDRHSQWLLALAYRILQNKSDAEDLLHDVFLEIWRKADTFNVERGTVTSWLAVKMRSRALGRLRSLKAIQEHTATDQINASDFQTKADDVTTASVQAKSQKMMECLTPNQRTVIELSYFHGLTCQEISKHCRMPLGTVKSHLIRAIQSLRKELNVSGEYDYGNR